MNTYTYFDSFGQVQSLYSGPVPEAMDVVYPEFSRIEGAIDGKTHYIDLTDPAAPTPTLRPASPITREGLTLLDVPAGATLHIDGVAYPVTEGGSVALEFPLPGSYSIRVEAFPCVDFADTVTVTAGLTGTGFQTLVVSRSTTLTGTGVEP